MTIDGLGAVTAEGEDHRGYAPAGSAHGIEPNAAFDAATTAGALIVDVRTNEEWCLVGVPNLREVLFLQWADTDGEPNETFLDELRHWIHRNVPLYVLSRSGGDRALGALGAARSAGFTDVAVIAGGFEGPLGVDGRRGHAGWKASGLPWRQW